MRQGLRITVEYQLRVVVYPAPDIAGQWIAHCLETDMVTQGDSVADAIAMMGDALQTLGSFNVAKGRYAPAFLPLRPAPREVWDLVGTAAPSQINARALVTAPGRRNAAGQLAPETAWPIMTWVSKKAPQVHAR